jgi:hypothetical protein
MYVCLLGQWTVVFSSSVPQTDFIYFRLLTPLDSIHIDCVRANLLDWSGSDVAMHLVRRTIGSFGEIELNGSNPIALISKSLALETDFD